MIGMHKLVSFVDRTRVESALTLAFLISLAWVFALALLLRDYSRTFRRRRVQTPAAPRGATGAAGLLLEIDQALFSSTHGPRWRRVTAPAVALGENAEPVVATAYAPPASVPH